MNIESPPKRREPAEPPTDLPDFLPLVRRGPDSMKKWTFLSSPFCAEQRPALIKLAIGAIKAGQFKQSELCWLYSHNGRVAVGRLHSAKTAAKQCARQDAKTQIRIALNA